MAKALKAVAIVAGVAALAVVTGGAAAGLGLSLATTAFGVSASALLATTALASTAASLLTKAPKVPTAQTDRLTASIDPRAFRKTVLGQTAFPVDVRYEEWSGNDQEYCDWIVALASHAIDGIEEIWLNTEMAWSQTTGVTAKYRGYFSIPNLVLEGSPANAFSFASGRWNGSARLTGCAYARLRFKVTGNSKKAESPFASGIPSRITIIGRGAKLYDPRRDSTVPGGSGPMRAGDQSTWRYTADDGAVIGENLPLHILRVVLGWRIRNPVTGEMKLATGSGVPARRLNLGSWITAANLADEQVNRSAGGTEPRYHGAGVISEGDEPKTSLDAMCAACCARFRDTSGKLSIAISYNDLANAATDDGLGNDDVVGGFTWDPDPSLAATPNVIRGRYVDASTNSLYQLIDYPEVRLASPDGQDRIFPLDLGVVESASHAQRVAKQVLQRRQYQREFTAPFDIRAWKYTIGDVVPFTFAPLSFTRALFRVKEQELGQGGTCNMTLTVEHPQIYAFDRDDAAPVLAAEPIVYDASRNPLILAIADAGNTATWDGVTGTAKPADNATNSADPNSPFGPGRTVGETIATLDRIEPIAAATDLLKKANIDQDALQRQATRDVGKLDQALLRALLESNRTREVMRDAGIIVDPATGRVRIHGVDQTSERVSKVEIDLDATRGRISLLASSDYVNEQIARAQLDPTGQGALDEIITRLTSAEIELDGLDAIVRLKADSLIVTTLGGRVVSVEQELDALAGELLLKASATEVSNLDTRVKQAELKLTTVGDMSALTIAVRQARYAADDAATGGLQALLSADTQHRRQLVAAAEARQELYTRLVDGDAAEAIARQVLAAKVGEADARAGREESARIEGDRAAAQALTVVEARIGQAAEAQATRLDRAIADGDRVIGEAIQQVTARLNGNGVSIEDKVQAIVEATGKITGTRTIAIDINGNMVGTQLVGAESGFGSLNLINADLRLGTGRIIRNNGTVMEVQGIGFGAHRDLLSWFGPTMAIDQCSKANALEYKGTAGDIYTTASLSAGVLKNNGASSGLATDEVASVGPFGSNGRPVRFIASWSYRREFTKFYAPNTDGVREFDADRRFFNAVDEGGGAWFGTSTTARTASTITLDRSLDGSTFNQMEQRSFVTETATFNGVAPQPADSAAGNASFSTAIGGGFTVNDPVQIAGNRWLRLRLARSFSYPLDGTVQRLTIIAVEE